jgi:hypothetical protein
MFEAVRAEHEKIGRLPIEEVQNGPCRGRPINSDIGGEEVEFGRNLRRSFVPLDEAPLDEPRASPWGMRSFLLVAVLNVKRMQRTPDAQCVGESPRAQIGEISRMHDRLESEIHCPAPGPLTRPR